MPLELFAMASWNGNYTQADYMFTGKAGDLMAVADVLGDVHSPSSQLRTVPALDSGFNEGDTYSIPYVKLTKAQCRVLMMRSLALANPCPRPPKPADSLTY